MNPPPALRTILLASSNPGKLREIQSAMGDLPVRWTCLADLGRPIQPPEETGETFEANAIAKAIYYSQASGLWTLADDSGLEVDALGGAPGVQSARYAGADQNDAANNAKLLDELKDVPDEARTARFRCELALADDQRVLAQASGVIEGRIVRQPRGRNGFGYDPLFLVPSLGRTTAELSREHKNAISHRGQAVRELHRLLERLLEAGPGSSA